MGEGKRARNHADDRPKIFKLKEGRPIFEGIIVDHNAKEQQIAIRRLRFYCPTQSSPMRVFREGETFLKVLSEGEDSDTKIDLRNISSLEIINSAFISKKYPGRMFVKIGVTPKKGGLVEHYLLPRGVELCATAKSTNFEKSWYLYTINKIVRIKRSSDISNKSKTAWYPETHKGKDLEQASLYQRTKKKIKSMFRKEATDAKKNSHINYNNTNRDSDSIDSLPFYDTKSRVRP